MAGGGIVAGHGVDLHAEQYHGKLTVYVVFVALMAASGGLLFGYDLGVTGGVESMASFQQKFFPDVYARTELGAQNTSPYCTYDNQKLQTFTSILFLAGLFASLPAGHLTRAYGRKVTMTVAGISFLIGAGLNAGAQDLAMLIIGRIFLGIGVGNANQAVPLYLSETAPYKYRGALNQLFQLATTIGILVAQLINYGVNDWDNGWRLSLGLAAVPASVLTLGGILLPESPNSLIERGHVERGRQVLERLRGTSDVDAEVEDIKEASIVANSIGLRQSWRIMFSRAYSPMLIVTVTIACLQQFTGINAIMFYVPVIFNSLGSGRKASLLNTVIIGAVNVVSTFVAIFTVDRLGRRFLFLEGGFQMIIALVVTAITLGVEFSTYNTANLPSSVAIGVLIVICVFVSGFAWSWGPLGWLVPSEIQTMETRPAGMSAAVLTNFLFSFVIGQSFLSMLCAMKWGVFLFFGGFVVIATLFIYFLLPEVKGVPVERVQGLFASHPLWRKLMGDAADEILKRERARTQSRLALAASNGKVVGNGKDSPVGGVAAQNAAFNAGDNVVVENGGSSFDKEAEQLQEPKTT